MPSAKLTSRSVTSAKPAGRLFIIYDTDLPGFGLRVMPSGFKSWIVEYRPKGAGRTAPKKRLTIGSTAVVTAAKARGIAKDTLADVRQGRDPLADRHRESTAPKVAELARRFLEEHVDRPPRKPTTAALYRQVIERVVLPRLGLRKATSVTRLDLMRIHAELSEASVVGAQRVTMASGEPRERRRGGPVIANRTLAVIGSMYAWAGRRGLVPEDFNPTFGIERNPEQGRERYLTMAELERLGHALTEAETIGLRWRVNDARQGTKHLPAEDKQRTLLSPHAVAAVGLLILTGCRLREILHLRWQDVDTERGMLHLPDSKTGRKSIVLNAPALAILADIPRVGSFVVAGRAPMSHGDPERPRSDLKKPWRAVQRAAGLEGVRLHDLRHSFASGCRSPK